MEQDVVYWFKFFPMVFSNSIFFNSKNIPKVNIYFKDIFPISLGGLEFMQDAGDIEYLKIDASFRFMYYEFENATK